MIRTPYRSTFTEVERQFQTLTTAPCPLTVDGYEIDPGLPDRPIPLGELRAILLSGKVGNDVKNAAWSALIARARKDPERWIVGCVGVMLPGLRRIARSLTLGYSGDVQDIESEILLGFLEMLQTLDPDRRSIPALLWWSAKRRGAAALAAELKARSFSLLDRDVLSPRRVVPAPGHPDLVLARAVSHGVVTAEDAELVGTTRLASEPLEEVAHRMGLTYAACRKRRSRAEERLVRFLRHPGTPGTGGLLAVPA